MFRHKLKELWLAKMAVDPIFKPGLDSEETKRQALGFCKDHQKKMKISQTEWDTGDKTSEDFLRAFPADGWLL